MAKYKNIPKQILDFALNFSCNSAIHLDGDIYSLQCLDEQGNPMPIGTPLLVKYTNGKCTLLNGREAELFIKSLGQE